jgi:hypothetical protein
MRELENLLPTLQPPAGGLARLQRHVAMRDSHGRAPRKVKHPGWTIAACVSLIIAAIVINPWIAQRRQTQALTVALRGAISANRLGAGIRVTDGAAIELPSGQSNVRLYLVQTAPRAARKK